MSQKDYILVRIDTVLFGDFFNLIKTNKSYIEKGFAVTVRRCATKEGAKELYNQWVSDEKKGDAYSFFINHSKSNNLVGLVNVKNIDKQARKAEMGYFISQQATGKGITTKLTQEVVTYCFETLQMNKVFLRVFPENIASQRVALKIGFKQEGLLRHDYLGHNNQYEDVLYFGLLKFEYQYD